MSFVVSWGRLVRVLALSVGVACLVGACSEKNPVFSSIDVSGAEFGKDFTLLDTDGQPRRLADYRGKVVMLFFGYTQCPDVCPTTMTELAQAKGILGADGSKVVGLFVTVDPDRDTAEVLKAYTANFGPDMHGMRASGPGQLAALAKDLRVYYKPSPGKNPGQYTMDHTAASYIYDPQGRLRLYTRYGQGAQALAADIAQLLK
jgi:protein SCO1